MACIVKRGRGYGGSKGEEREKQKGSQRRGGTERQGAPQHVWGGGRASCTGRGMEQGAATGSRGSCSDWWRFGPVPRTCAAAPAEPKQCCVASDCEQVWPRGQLDWGGMPGCGARGADERMWHVCQIGTGQLAGGGGGLQVLNTGIITVPNYTDM